MPFKIYRDEGIVNLSSIGCTRITIFIYMILAVIYGKIPEARREAGEQDIYVFARQFVHFYATASALGEWNYPPLSNRRVV